MYTGYIMTAKEILVLMALCDEDKFFGRLFHIEDLSEEDSRQALEGLRSKSFVMLAGDEVTVEAIIYYAVQQAVNARWLVREGIDGEMVFIGSEISILFRKDKRAVQIYKMIVLESFNEYVISHEGEEVQSWTVSDLITGTAYTWKSIRQVERQVMANG